MLHELRTLVVVDESADAQPITSALLEAFSEMVVETTNAPSALGRDYDVYVVDCASLGVDLARTLRADSPDALVVACSPNPSASMLKDLVIAGVNGACDPTDEHDLAMLVGLVRQHVVRRNARPGATGLLGVMRSMSDLIRNWNQRLDRLETR